MMIFFSIIVDEAEKPANLDDFIKLITQETYDKIDAIEKDSKCAFSVLVRLEFTCHHSLFIDENV